MEHIGILQEWLQVARDLKWLDVGCGNGAFSSLISNSCFPSHVFDPSSEQIDATRALQSRGCNVH